MVGGWQRRERTKTDRIKEDILKCGENEKGVNAAEFNGGPAVEITQSTVCCPTSV